MTNIIRDLNANIGIEKCCNTQVNTVRMKSQNDNGGRAINLAAAKGKIRGNIHFPHMDIIEWYSQNQIDHTLITGYFSNVLNFRSYRRANIDSDHYLGE